MGIALLSQVCFHLLVVSKNRLVFQQVNPLPSCMTFSFALRVAIATMLTAATPLVFAQTKRAHNLENNQSIISNELWSTVLKADYIGACTWEYYTWEYYTEYKGGY